MPKHARQNKARSAKRQEQSAMSEVLKSQDPRARRSKTIAWKRSLDASLFALGSLPSLPFAPCCLIMRSNVFRTTQGEKKWQTYQFVRNQMDHIWSKEPSTCTTRRATRFRLTIGRASRCAGAALRRTNLSATARTARLVFRPRNLLIPKALNRQPNTHD